MSSIRNLIVIKSDQINAEDFGVGESKTITITRYKVTGNGDQPLSLYFTGDKGKAYRPCKTIMKVLDAVWGEELDNYVGRSMTLICDPKVRFGADEVGGIRLTHVSHINAPMSVMVTVTRSVKKPYRVLPLHIVPGAEISTSDALHALHVSAGDGLSALQEAWGMLPASVRKAISPSGCPADLKSLAEAADKQRADAAADAQARNDALAGNGSDQ